MFHLVCVGPGKIYFWALKGIEKALNSVLPKVHEPCIYNNQLKAKRINIWQAWDLSRVKHCLIFTYCETII